LLSISIVNNVTNNSQKQSVILEVNQKQGTKLEEDLVKLTNDELKFMNNLVGQINQISDQINSSLNRTAEITNSLEDNAVDEVNRARETSVEVNLRLFRSSQQSGDNQNSSLIKAFIYVLIVLVILAYLIITI
jgi:hypothetical protein